MCDSEAEKILFILNKHERAYRRLIPVYIFLAIVLWILPILLIVYLYFCIVDNAVSYTHLIPCLLPEQTGL
ncbi:hypothetical protein AZZ65_004796, partial [Escherichia coli]